MYRKVHNVEKLVNKLDLIMITEKCLLDTIGF